MPSTPPYSAAPRLERPPPPSSTQAASAAGRASRSGRAHPTYPRSRVLGECRSLSTACPPSPSQRTCSRDRSRWGRGQGAQIAGSGGGLPASARRAQPRVLPAARPAFRQPTRDPTSGRSTPPPPALGPRKCRKAFLPQSPTSLRRAPARGRGRPAAVATRSRGCSCCCRRRRRRAGPERRRAEGEGEGRRRRSGPGERRSSGLGSGGRGRRQGEPEAEPAAPLTLASPALSAASTPALGAPSRPRGCGAGPGARPGTASWSRGCAARSRAGLRRETGSAALPATGRMRERTAARAEAVRETLSAFPRPFPGPDPLYDPRPAATQAESQWVQYSACAHGTARYRVQKEAAGRGKAPTSPAGFRASSSQGPGEPDGQQESREPGAHGVVPPT